MSVLRQHVAFLLRLSPEAHLANIKESNNIISKLVEERAQMKGSFFTKLVQAVQNATREKQVDRQGDRYMKKQAKRDSVYEVIRERACQTFMSFEETKKSDEEMKKYARQATKVVKGKIFEGILALLSGILLGLTISWNTLPETVSFKFADNPVDLKYSFMPIFLKYFMITIHSIFDLFAIFVWNSNKFFGFADLMVALLTPFADWYFFEKYNEVEVLTITEVTLHSFLTVYICLRFWKYASSSPGQGLYSFDSDKDLSYLQNLTVFWVTRSAHLVSQVGSDIEKLRNKLIEKWGEANVDSVCPVFIYVTDKDEKGAQLVHDELADTNLYKSGAIQFGRPNFDRILQDYNITLSSSREYSNSFLAFCGSPRLANQLGGLKLSNDLLKTMLGCQIHNMEYFAENYGGVKSAGASALVEENVKGNVIKRSYTHGSEDFGTDSSEFS